MKKNKKIDRRGKTFYYNYRNWKVIGYDDTSGLWICRASDAFDYQYFSEKIILGG